MQYSIKDIEYLTGIKAHTLRIWESRYGIVIPNRSDSKIRWYSDDQARELLNISVLIKNGYKISKVSKLTTKEIHNALDDLFKGSIEKNAYADAAISRLIQAALTYDVVGFNTVYDDAIRRFGLLDGYGEIIYPLLVKIGLMWNKNEMIPSQEHFISNIIKQKIFSSINATQSKEEPTETWTLFLPQDERHEIGLLFAYFVLKVFNKKVVYLGQDVPHASVKDVVEVTKSDYVYFFTVRRNDSNKIKRLVETMLKDFKDVKICVSGAGYLESIAEEIKGLEIIKSKEQLIELAKKK